MTALEGLTGAKDDYFWGRRKMEHFSRLLTLSTLFMCLACAGGQDLSRYDLSTDEGLTAAREAVSGKRLGAYSKGCVRRSPDLPNIIVVGSFAHDRGCAFHGVFIDSSYFEGEASDVSRRALNALGWETSDAGRREELARLWVERGLLSFVTVLARKSEDFPIRRFQPPRAITTKDGDIVVTVWVRLPPGRREGTAYQLLEYGFSNDAELLGRTTVEELVLRTAAT
jgi:hypothetical protein